MFKFSDFAFYVFRVLKLCSLFASKNNKISSSILNSDRLQKWGYFIFCFFLPFTLFKFFMEIKLVLTEGYYAYYTSSLSIPFFISISRFFFEFGFFIFLSSLPSKKKFLSVSKIYLLVISLFFLIGVRNRAVLSFLFVLWFYYRFYANKPPKLIFMLSVAVVCIVILLLVQLFRQSGVFLLDDNRSIFNYFFMPNLQIFIFFLCFNIIIYNQIFLLFLLLYLI